MIAATADNTVAAVLEHARRAPERPWLFHRPELDWRWRCWRQVAAQMLAGPIVTAGELSEAGTAVPYRDYGDPDSIALDLALAAAGYDPQPLPSRPWPPEGQADLPELTVEAAPGRFAPAGDLPNSHATPAGGALVLDHGHWRPLGATTLARSATEALSALPPAPRRDILVLDRSLAEPAQRLLLTWAAVTGAALVLLPRLLRSGTRPEEPEAIDGWRLDTLAWVRPTLLHGTAAELAALRRRLEPRFRRPWPWHRRPRLAPPLDRLRGVVVFGREALADDETSFWERAGVAMVAVTDPLAPPPGAEPMPARPMSQD